VKQSQRIAKNTLFGFLGGVFGGGLQFLSLLLVAWYLGVANFGIFSYLLAFATIFQYVADFGLSRILIREIALHPSEIERLLGGAKSLIWILFGFTSFAALAVIAALPIDRELKALSWLMTVGYLCHLHTIGYASVLRATENMEFNSIAFTLHKAVMVLFLWLFLSLKWGLFGVVLAHLGANLFLWAYYHIIVTTAFSPGRLLYAPRFWKELLTDALPMAGSLILRQSAWQLDVLILSFLVSTVDLGYFSGPFRLLMGMTVFATLFAQPLFPLFVRLGHESIDQFAVVYRRTLKWFCVLSFPGMVLCLSWPKICLFLFLGKHFLPAAPALIILSAAIIPLFISVLYPFIFSALNRQADYFFIMLTLVVARVLLEIFCVPRFGYLSEGYIVVAMESLVFIVLTVRLRLLNIHPHLFSTMGKPALASLPCFLIMTYLPHGSYIAMAFSILLCSIVYPLFLVLWKTISPEEFLLLREGLGFAKPYWQKIDSIVTGMGRKK